MLAIARFILLFCCVCGGVWGDDKIPARLAGVGIDEQLDADLPLDVKFQTETGATVTFGDLLRDKRPMLLTLNYSNCPGLCVAQLNGLTRGINEVSSLRMGKDFKFVSLSIDPTDSIAKASATKARYADDLENKHSIDGWHFLTGTEENIQIIAKSVGFNYTYDAKHDQYNHSAAAMMISPKGRITRYLYEIGFTGETLKMALVEAGEGKIGSSLDAFVLWCSHYDANENRYSASARLLLSVCAGGFVTVGLVGLLPFWISNRKRKVVVDSMNFP
ncbi:MAG: SCO family protein [Pirellula sp.]|nr:SCO family protein [Pirellula sp.]